MKTSIAVLLACSVASWSAFAQPGPARMGMASRQLAPGISASTARLFGDNKAFSADLQMRTGHGPSAESMTIPGKIYFDDGKSRFEMDMSRVQGGMMSPQAAAHIKSMGMDQTIVISRPDKKMAYQVYPGMQAYIETQLPEKESEILANEVKLQLTELGKEDVDGHSCVKNKALVTEKDGSPHEATVWNATDLNKFPLKIETTENGSAVTMLFSQVSLTKPAAALFEPPSNATKYDSMQSMMQQVMMKRGQK